MPYALRQPVARRQALRHLHETHHALQPNHVCPRLRRSKCGDAGAEAIGAAEALRDTQRAAASAAFWSARSFVAFTLGECHDGALEFCPALRRHIMAHLPRRDDVVPAKLRARMPYKPSASETGEITEIVHYVS